MTRRIRGGKLAGPALAALALLVTCLGPAGCRNFSRTRPPDAKPEALPLERPLAGQVIVARGPDPVKAALETLSREEGATPEGGSSPVTLVLQTRFSPGNIPVAIDVLNFLTAFLVPKIRESELKVTGSLHVGGEKRLETEATGSITSWELWLPYVFFPPAWPGVVEGWGGPPAVSVYEELARSVIAELDGRRDEIGPVTAAADGGEQPAELSPCDFCGEPRGAVTPCPHCGIE